MASRALVGAVVCLLALARPAAADELPPGSLGACLGAASGTGADAKALGFGYLLGGQAAWQPMATEQRVNWALKWNVLFGTMYAAEAARIDSNLLMLQMDLMPGIRIRPGNNPGRYVTMRAGGSFLRTNEEIPPHEQRAFVGAIASLGLDQYLSGWLFNIDIRYSLIGTGPFSLGLVIGFAKTGP